MARRPAVRPTATWVAIPVIAVLAITVGALSLFAYQRAHPTVAMRSAAPVPTFSSETPSPEPPAPSPTALAPTIIDRTIERFFSVASRAMWRGVAGRCGVASPLVERSADGGRTWVDVTPLYKQLTQVASLDAFTPTEGQLVGGVGVGCQTQALRTFTQGQFWESYPDVLAASSFVDLNDPSLVVTPGGTIAAPCATATGLRSAGTRLGIVCDGQAYTLDAARSWQAVGVGDAVAVAFSADGLLVGHEQSTCAGLAITLAVDAAAPIDVGCAADVDPSDGAIALATDGSRVLVWAGDSIVDVAP